jgi:putative addiction module antidote
MSDLKLRKIGNSYGVILPREAVEHLRIAEGETLHLSRVPGGVQLTAHDPDFADGMKALERTRRKYRNALRELAK